MSTGLVQEVTGLSASCLVQQAAIAEGATRHQSADVPRQRGAMRIADRGAGRSTEHEEKTRHDAAQHEAARFEHHQLIQLCAGSAHVSRAVTTL